MPKYISIFSIYIVRRAYIIMQYVNSGRGEGFAIVEKPYMHRLV